MPGRPDPRPRKQSSGRPGRPDRPFKKAGRPFKKAAGRPFKKAAGRPFKKAGGRPYKNAAGRTAKKAAPRREGRPEGRAGGWGGVARRGAGSGGSAGRMRSDSPSAASDAFREAAPADWEPERLERVDEASEPLRNAARRAVDRAQVTVDRSRSGSSRSKRVAPALTDELAREAGAAAGPKLAERLSDAGRAFERERYDDARRILLPLVKRAPGAPAVRELLGLVWYRLGRWKDAATELEAFRALTASTEQHPVLADSYRALRRYDEVEALWRELKEASPSAELVAEGRIVVAGSLADRGDLEGAIAMITPAVTKARKPRGHQLRLLYVLADLYERAGDVPRARLLFDRILAADDQFADTPSRRRALG